MHGVNMKTLRMRINTCTE